LLVTARLAAGDAPLSAAGTFFKLKEPPMTRSSWLMTVDNSTETPSNWGPSAAEIAEQARAEEVRWQNANPRQHQDEMMRAIGHPSYLGPFDRPSAPQRSAPAPAPAAYASPLDSEDEFLASCAEPNVDPLVMDAICGAIGMAEGARRQAGARGQVAAPQARPPRSADQRTRTRANQIRRRDRSA
jgi:hypothetical protein